MLTAKLKLETTTGSTFDEKVVTISRTEWKQDKAFISLVKEMQAEAQRLTHKWQVAGEEDAHCYLTLEPINPDDQSICYKIDDQLDSL